MIYSSPLRTLTNSIYEDVLKSEFVNEAAIQTGEFNDDIYFDKDIVFSTIDQTLSNFLCFPLPLSQAQANINAGALTGKIDFFDTKNKVVHETKRSNKVEQAHIWQVKFYLWLMELNEIEVEKGILEYPKLREREEVFLDEEDIRYLQKTVVEIKELLNSENCPPVINAKICKSCSYYDFCYVAEG